MFRTWEKCERKCGSHYFDISIVIILSGRIFWHVLQFNVAGLCRTDGVSHRRHAGLCSCIGCAKINTWEEEKRNECPLFYEGFSILTLCFTSHWHPHNPITKPVKQYSDCVGAHRTQRSWWNYAHSQVNNNDLYTPRLKTATHRLITFEVAPFRLSSGRGKYQFPLPPEHNITVLTKVGM